jgi:hypothetical protein
MDVWIGPKTGKEIQSYTIITYYDTGQWGSGEDPYQNAGDSPAGR